MHNVGPLPFPTPPVRGAESLPTPCQGAFSPDFNLATWAFLPKFSCQTKPTTSSAGCKRNRNRSLTSAVLRRQDTSAGYIGNRNLNLRRHRQSYGCKPQTKSQPQSYGGRLAAANRNRNRKRNLQSAVLRLQTATATATGRLMAANGRLQTAGCKRQAANVVFVGSLRAFPASYKVNDG